VLTTLAAYLLEYKKVVIPGIGTFEMHQQSATLNYADRLILPPVREIRFYAKGEIEEAQLQYLSRVTASDTEAIRLQLAQLGEDLGDKINQSSFDWKGIGQLEKRGADIVFNSTFQNNQAPVTANKVIHENASHAVTIGDQEMQSHAASEMLLANEEPNNKSYAWIVWVLIGLALLAIGYLLYTKKFNPLASGLQKKIAWNKAVEKPFVKHSIFYA
jgi:hypothetical protein